MTQTIKQKIPKMFTYKISEDKELIHFYDINNNHLKTILFTTLIQEWNKPELI